MDRTRMADTQTADTPTAETTTAETTTAETTTAETTTAETTTAETPTAETTTAETTTAETTTAETQTVETKAVETKAVESSAARTRTSRADSAPWRTSLSKRLQVELIARLGYPILSGWGSTYRFRTEGAENIDRALALGSPIASFWHGRIVPALIYFRGRNVAAMASESFDGEWISRLLSQFGYRTIRGSNSRGARRATLQMLRDVKNTPIALTVDGPRGPNRVAHPGATWLARASGNPVLPFHLEADRFFTLRHWDKSQVPKLGARVAAVIGEPFVIPAASSDAELESYRLRLEESLRRCEARCHELLAGRERTAVSSA